MKKNANEKLKIWLNADLNTKDSSNESEVECPYCYAIYRIDKCGTSFECSSCKSLLEINFDKYRNPYIANY